MGTCVPDCVCVVGVQYNIIIIIIQEVSVAHNPELKAGAQGTHRKLQNELPI